MSFSVDTVFSELGHCRDLFPPGVESLSLSSTIPSFVSSFLLSVLVSIFFFSTVSRFLVFSPHPIKACWRLDMKNIAVTNQDPSAHVRVRP